MEKLRQLMTTSDEADVCTVPSIASHTLMHYTVKGTDTLEHLCLSRIKIISRCIIWTKHDYSFIGWLKEKYSLLFMYSNEHGRH